MRSLVTGLLLLAALSLAVSAQPWPCPGCDCQGDGCFQAGCGCRRPTAQDRMDLLLEELSLTLRSLFGPRLDLVRPVSCRFVPPASLPVSHGERVKGSYHEGVICLSADLAGPEALVILAHEYGHAWQEQKHPRPAEISERLGEGFAEWLAYRVARSRGLGQAATEILQSTLPGAEGARYLLHLEQRGGLEQVLRVATTWLDLDGNP